MGQSDPLASGLGVATGVVVAALGWEAGQVDNYYVEPGWAYAEMLYKQCLVNYDLGTLSLFMMVIRPDV